VHPADFGLAKASPAQLRGGDAAANAEIARAILAGESGAPRDIVLLNAAASLLIAGRVASIAAGVRAAADALDSGAAARVLAQLVHVSNAGREATT
jgi:anthranilate phosphoribosyltransferase